MPAVPDAQSARREVRTPVSPIIWGCEIAASFLFGKQGGGFLYTGNKLLAAIAGLHKHKQIYLFYIDTEAAL